MNITNEYINYMVEMLLGRYCVKKCNAEYLIFFKIAKFTKKNFLYICKEKAGRFMVQPQTTTIPNTGSGTINIHINNPSVGAGVGMPQYTMPYTYPAYYPYFAYPPNYYMGNMGGINQSVNVNGLGGYPAGYPGYNANGTNNNDNINRKNINETNINTSENKKQREIVVLTDNYIKNLENYLKSNNVELRKNAVKEILTRFKEDKSRIDNPSLTALLNIALQDPNSVVRSVAMTALEAGYAKGNSLTEQLLRNMQTQKSNFSSDAIQASDGLLQMSKTKAMVPDNSFYPSQPSQKSSIKEGA